MNQIDPWVPLRFDSEDGHGLVRPRFQIRLRVEKPQPQTVLAFYEAVQELIGESLRFYTTGSGTYSRWTKRTDTIIPTWCSKPVLWPKNNYAFIAQHTSQGIDDVELKIYYAARELKPPPVEWYQRLLDGAHLPRYFSTFWLSLPTQHELLKSGAIVDWIRAAAPVHDASFIGGAAGWAIDIPLNIPWSAFELRGAAYDRAAALLQRHPGLSCESHMATGLTCLKWDLDFARTKQAAQPRPYAVRADWITLLNADQLCLLGGFDPLRGSLKGANGVSIEALGNGALIQAGSAPQLGDLSIGHVPIEYRAVAQAIKPVTLPIGDLDPHLGNSFREEGLRTWYDALAKA